MKRVLVTGASGFFGRHCLNELLHRGYEVHACARHVLDQPGAKWHVVDLIQPGAGAELVRRIRPTHLLHLAWDVSSGFWSAPDNISWVAATLSLMRAFHLSGGERFVAAGTCAEYDWTNLPDYVGEDARREPATFYGTAKENARRLIEGYSRETGFSFAWGVLFLSFGSHERAERLVPSIIRNLLAGRVAETTAGTQLRDFLDSREVAAAFSALVDCSVNGSVNIASGEARALRDVIQLLGRLMGRSDMLRLGALKGRPNEPQRLVADITRLRQEVGFVPRISLDQGLQDAISWWRRQQEA
ncbi:NAD(P)-dependent oxidoreductase (plasmid) [Rhizobium sp. CB3171]|uniref:NAD-dependent epimerase/dehydratase family protein n=1 Tax=Rhizobium sp. CB3171 TaxID=3039157 RepID=UPI0024B0CFA3|nr:NAD(P)-dependent oxidoreductase [Rhizobium sp. CB3171]WFU05942.1 NAD(P)-dependent oxidoreductase [Rhizobium sp. CB3171]